MTHNDNRENALSRIINCLTSPQMRLYAVTLGGIVLAQQAATPETLKAVTSALTTPGGMVGLNLFTSLVDTLAGNLNGMKDDEIHIAAENAIQQSHIADLLTRDQFRQDIARLAGGMNLRILKKALEDGQQKSVVILIDEMEKRHLLLMAEIMALRFELKGAAGTPVSSAVPTTPIVVLPEIPEDEQIRQRGGTIKLFISYSRRDKLIAHQFAKKLSEEYFYDVWLDYDSISAGAKWMEEIARGILTADRVLFLASPHSVGSDYCLAEVDYALKHGITVIPIRITDALPMGDLSKAGLDQYNALDRATLSEAEFWKKLLNPAQGLPEVMPRNRRLLDPEFKALHRDYLRSLFARYEEIPLRSLLDATQKEAVSLLDIYVPLKLGVSFNLEVQDGKYVDWWLRDQDAPREPRENEHPEAQKPKMLKGFAPQGKAMNVWEQRLIAGWEAFKADHEAEQTKKEEKKRESLKDGTYYWNRIESEVAPALVPHLVITGSPGSGKSTLLKHLMLCLAGQMLEDEKANLKTLNFWPLPAYTPVYVELRALVRTAFPRTSDKIDLKTFLDYIEQEQLVPRNIGAYRHYLEEQMGDGDVMIFLDGLDEVPDAENPERREQIKTLAKELRKQYPHCPVVVTSRPYAYNGDWKLDGDHYGQVDLIHLDPDRLERLAERLFAVVREKEGAEEEAAEFKKQIAKISEKLRSSPLFFTLMASIWLNNEALPVDQRLPGEEGAIYRECVNMLIRRWTRKDLEGISTAEAVGLTEAQLRQLLEMLAHQVHSEQGDKDDALFESGTIMTILRRDLKIKHIDFNLLLESLAQRAGVIYERAPEEFQFAHRSFQEHLSACYLAQKDFPGLIVNHIREGVGLWRNVLELLPAELSREQLWKLTQAMLPKKEVVLPTEREDPAWYGIYYGARWMKTYILPEDEDLRELWRERLKVMLTQLLQVRALAPVERAEMGRLLAEIGDSRPGVGIDTNGLPDIYKTWCSVPAGTFWMGSDKDKDPEAQDEELPQHEETIEYNFKVAKYLVTYQQFQTFLADPAVYEQEKWWDDFPDEYKKQEMKDQHYQYANHPRENVSWYQAVAFTRWLTVKYQQAGIISDQEEICLPTEREWEYAARGKKEDGTDPLIYPYGDEFDATKANTSETGIGQTSAVGLFEDLALPFGVQDMSGNVFEWCLTKWGREYPDGAEDNEVDASGVRRVRRGGSFNYSYFTDFTRCAYRDSNNPGYRDSYFGFRVVFCPKMS